MFGRKKISQTPDGAVAESSTSDDSPGSSRSTGSTVSTGATLNGEPADLAGPGSTRTPGSGAKGAPTPKRRDQVAARQRPLVPNDRKVARTAAREAQASERAKVRMALETGDERNMPLRDRGPQRRFVRDWVDARTGLAEWLMLVVLVYVFLAFLPSAQMQLVLTFSLWGLVLLVVLEAVLLRRSLRKKLEQKFGEVERGVPWYGVMRSLQLRRLRLPKPQVKRGQFPEV